MKFKSNLEMSVVLCTSHLPLASMGIWGYTKESGLVAWATHKGVLFTLDAVYFAKFDP